MSLNERDWSLVAWSLNNVITSALFSERNKNRPPKVASENSLFFKQFSKKLQCFRGFFDKKQDYKKSMTSSLKGCGQGFSKCK